MQWVNLQFRIFHRDGTPATPAARPGTSSSPASRSAEARPGTAATRSSSTTTSRSVGSQAQLASPTYPNGPFFRCVAYSSTSDPTGTWCAYQYLAHPTNLNDYPKFGVWPTQHAYMITVNQFHEPGDAWAGVGVFALERDALMSGCGGARMLYKDMLPVEPNLWGGMLPGRRGRRDAPAGKRSGASDRGRRPGMGSGALPGGSTRRLERDSQLAGSGTINVSHEGPLPTAPFDGDLCGFAACIPQPGTTTKLDTLNDRLMYRLAYRNFGDHQALVVNHSVDTNGADPRWCALVRVAQDDRQTGRSTSRARTSRTRRSTAGWARPHGSRRQHGRRLSTSSGTAPNYPASAMRAGSRPIRSAICRRARRR